tara:strand:- start:1283 stop:3175 length:1893 start_codon:yes stop_codon:yes gene_type:complete
MIKLSVVTITLNDVKTIEKTIKSVIDQNYSNLEYIVIDGGSTDGTLEILNKYKEKFTYFKSSPDKSIYDAMNKGIAQANGDFIGFINGGDFIYENTLKNINEVFSRKKNKLFFSVADLDYIDNENNIVGTRVCRPKDQIIKRRYIEMPTNHLGIFVPLETFKKYGLFDLRFKNRADFYFVLKLMRDGYEPLNLQKKIGAFRLGGISGGYSTFLENYRIIRLVGGKFIIAVYSTILGITKLFLQRNFPLIYKFIAQLYYKLNKDIQKKEVFAASKIKIIHIIDSDLGGGAEKLVKSIKQNFSDNQKIITLKKLSEKNINDLNYNSLNLKSDSLFSVISATLGIIKILFEIKNRESVLLHSHLSKSLYASFLPSILFGINHIHTEHNTYNKRRSKSYLYPIEYLIYNSLKHIICISEPTRFELLSYMPSIKLQNTSVIENGTKLYQYQVRDFKKEKFNVVILGSLTFKKGIDIFLETLPFLLNKINQVKIIGSGPEKENLHNLTKKLSLESVVKFISFTDDPSSHLYDSDIGIIPSRWEGFGLVALEMRSSGLPILISDTPGLYSIFSGYNGVYSFKTESKESLKNSLSLLLNNMSKNAIKIKNINSDLEIYSENSFIERYDNLYKNLENIQ